MIRALVGALVALGLLLTGLVAAFVLFSVAIVVLPYFVGAVLVGWLFIVALRVLL